MGAPSGRAGAVAGAAGADEHGEIARGAPGRLRQHPLPALCRGAQPGRSGQGAGGPGGPAAANRGLFPPRHWPAGTRRLPAAPGRRAVLALVFAERPSARGGHGRGRTGLQRHPGRTPGACLLWTGDPPGRLDHPAVLVLLLLQPLAFGLPRRQRPRVGLGDGHAVPVRGRRATGAGVGRLRLARFPWRRPAPALGRYGRPDDRERPPGGACRGRVALVLLPAGRIPGGSEPALAGLDGGTAAILEQVLDRDARPAGGERLPRAVRGLRPGRRAADRPGRSAGLVAGADR